MGFPAFDAQPTRTFLVKSAALQPLWAAKTSGRPNLPGEHSAPRASIGLAGHRQISGNASRFGDIHVHADGLYASHPSLLKL